MPVQVAGIFPAMRNDKRVHVEICVTSVAEALAAEHFGADSVELCTWLACGGVTPSIGTIATVLGSLHIPVRVLVRPGPGDFIYGTDDRRILLADVEALAAQRIGVVTGGLNEAGGADMELMRSVRRSCPDVELTFHRAIDHSTDPMEVVHACKELGVDRVLSSGGKSLAIDGAAMLKSMVHATGADMMIAAAGGINASNVVQLVELTGVREVHFAAQLPKPSQASGLARLSSSDQAMEAGTLPDMAKMEGVMNALVRAGLR